MSRVQPQTLSRVQPRIGIRVLVRIVAFVLLGVGLASVSSTRSQAAVDADQVKAAIKKGLEYLQKAATSDSSHGSGVPALAGLAMLEGGLPKTDPKLAEIIQIVRTAAYTDTQTYNVALDVLFLDRLDDPNDVPLIQVLGCRLLAGQNATGGWGYPTFPAVTDAERLRTALRPVGTGKLHPEAARLYDAVRKGLVRAPSNGDDNSNTQFAIVGLWVAQRRGVPCTDAFRAIDTRFLSTQSPQDWGWNYSPTIGMSTPSMTCAGLLGLAVGKAAAETKRSDRELFAQMDGRAEGRGPQGDADRKKENETDPFFNPPAKGEKPKAAEDEDDPDPEEPPPEMKKAKTLRDAAIERGLKALGTLLGGKGSGVPLGAGTTWGGVDDLYFIWSLERVAVAYGLPTIGDVDWYEWGARRLLPAQQADGSWTGGGHGGPVVQTSFALLFLLRANFTGDLTRSLGGRVKDPGSGELRGSRGGPLPIIAVGRLPDPKGPADPKAAALGPVRGASEADKIAESLLAKSSDAKWIGKLEGISRAKGGQNTAGLAMAIPFLPERRQILARDALADRLTRMTPETLERMLEDRDAELRRAACLAVGMRDEKRLTLKLIERVLDNDDAVVRAARAALKAMFRVDHGPTTGANEERKRLAYDEWLAWYKIDGPRHQP